MDLAWWELLVRIALAVAFGAVIGLDRELKNKPAGLRTMMLVALGSTSFTLLGAEAIDIAQRAAGESLNPPQISVDLSRVIAGIIGGIGFIGAGTIIQSQRGNVSGVTTAAGIWVTAAIGVGCGLGAYRLAISTGILAIFILVSVHAIEPAIMKKVEEQTED